MLSGYKIYVRVWYLGNGMGQPDEERRIPFGPFDSIEEARAKYESLTAKDFVTRRMIELRPDDVISDDKSTQTPTNIHNNNA